MSMKAVILAGGLGTRLSEETAVRPKPMVEVGGKPILWHIMKIYSAHGISVLLSWLSLGTAAPVLGRFPPDKAAGFGLSLPAVYAFTLLLVIALALASRAYAGLKRRRHEWWWSYL